MCTSNLKERFQTSKPISVVGVFFKVSLLIENIN